MLTKKRLTKNAVRRSLLQVATTGKLATLLIEFYLSLEWEYNGITCPLEVEKYYVYI